MYVYTFLEDSLLETILHWEGTEIGLLICEFAAKTATKPTRNDMEKKIKIGKRRARLHRNNTKGMPFFSLLSVFKGEASRESIQPRKEFW
jgi:hypothetical protein